MLINLSVVGGNAMSIERNNRRQVVWILAGVGVLAFCLCGGMSLLVASVVLMTAASRASNGAPPPAWTQPAGELGEWRALSDLPRKTNVFLFDPNDPSIAYAGTGRYVEGDNGLYRSDDSGATWSLANAGLPDDPVVALALSTDSSILYANLAVDTTIYASTDGAQTWHAVGENPELCCNVPRQLIVDVEDPARLYLVQPAADPNLSISTDGGASWTRVADPREELNPRTLAQDPQDVEHLYLGSDGHGVYVSTDRGATWTIANTGMIDYAVLSLAVSPIDGDHVYAGTADGHVFETLDGGATWRDLTPGLALEPHERHGVTDLTLDPAHPDTLIATIDLAGVLRSDDGGATWERMAVPQPRAMFPFPQEAAVAWAFTPELRGLLGLYYPDGEDSGAWLCTP